jgi:hypothetical protein
MLFAYHDQSGKTRQAGESFATMSLYKPRRFRLRGLADHPAGSDRRRLHRLWITCGQPVAPNVFSTLNVLG